MVRHSRVVTLGLAALTASLLACGAGTDPDGEGATIVDGASAPAGGSGSPVPVGTRQHPLEPGVAFRVNDWIVEFAPTNTDADGIIAAEFPLSRRPAEGRRFVMVEVTVTYAGEGSGNPLTDLRFAFYGSDGNTFAQGRDDRCGVIPNPLHEHGEMFPDATATGNVCRSVPVEQIEGGAWLVEQLWVRHSDRTFVALE